MTENEIKAREMFDEFMEHCEKYGILPQYIMSSHINEEFWKTFKNFWMFNGQKPETD